ncbi:MAG: SUMF1/EgtB/PvdO family nonheme iron enzyme, partial [Gammaproteobacteria bacterium]
MDEHESNPMFSEGSMRAQFRTVLLSSLVVVLALCGSASAVSIDWTYVGDPGNACDVQAQGCFGSVPYEYNIGTFEVTNSQYVEFLNAVAATDPNALYNANMDSYWGGIARSGSSGTFTYSAIAGHEDMPVNHVSFYDALRFANWLHNGQPSGPQD